MAPQKNRRPGFSRRAQYGLFLGYVAAVLGALVGAVLLALSAFNPPAYAVVRGAVREVTTPISSAMHWVRRTVGAVPDGIGEHFGTMDENRRLKKQLEQQGQLIGRARAINRENHRLRTLLRLRDRVVNPVVAARIVNSSASSTRRYATLNAGNWQGVRIGQPVRGPEGLIGRVIEVSPNTARILLVIDAESIVPVRRTSDGTPGIVAGRGDGMVDVRAAGITNVQFKPGDTFVTSGTGGLFPPNIPVARVVKSGQDQAEARVFANPDAVDFALVQRPFLDIPQPQPGEPAK